MPNKKGPSWTICELSELNALLTTIDLFFFTKTSAHQKYLLYDVEVKLVS